MIYPSPYPEVINTLLLLWVGQLSCMVVEMPRWRRKGSLCSARGFCCDEEITIWGWISRSHILCGLSVWFPHTLWFWESLEPFSQFNLTAFLLSKLFSTFKGWNSLLATSTSIVPEGLWSPLSLVTSWNLSSDKDFVHILRSGDLPVWAI